MLKTSHMLKVFSVATGMYAWIKRILGMDRNLTQTLRSTTNSSTTVTNWCRGNIKVCGQDENMVKAYLVNSFSPCNDLRALIQSQRGVKIRGMCNHVALGVV